MSAGRGPRVDVEAVLRIIAAGVGTHGVAGGSGAQQERDGGADQGRGGGAPPQDIASGGKACTGKASDGKPVVGHEPKADTVFKKHRLFCACPCGCEGKLRGNVLCFKCCVARNASSGVSPVRPPNVGSPVGGSNKPVAAGPVVVLRHVRARA